MISSNYNTLSLLTADSTTILQQLNTAQEQAATGRIADTYSGLGTGARTSLDLRPLLAHQQGWQTNIDSATSRLDITQTALTTISRIASNFYAQTNNLTAIGFSQVPTIAAAAQQALQQMGNLLNTKVGDVYVFAGQDTSNPPIPNTDPTVMANDLLASDTAAPPFSSTITSSVPTVEVGEGQKVQIGLLANANTLATSAAPTTGSYMRDIMRSLATLSQLTPTTPNLSTIAADTRSRLNSAISALSAETGALGNIQASLTTRRSALDELNTAVSKQLSNVENVDAAAAITKVTALQTQLQASYQLIAGERSLTLANFLK